MLMTKITEGVDAKRVGRSPAVSPRRVLGLSLFMIVRDEEDRIGDALASVVDLADEIVVVDSGSTDRTCEIARSYGARVLYRDWDGYGFQKNWAERQCKGPWLFNLDADEIVPDALSAEIRALFEEDGPCELAYSLPVAEQFPGESVPHRFARTNRVVRLYLRGAGSFAKTTVHDSVIVESSVSVGRLKSKLHHRSFRSLTSELDKINRYSDMQVADMRLRGRTVPTCRLFTEFAWAFLKAYVLRRAREKSRDASHEIRVHRRKRAPQRVTFGRYRSRADHHRR